MIVIVVSGLDQVEMSLSLEARQNREAMQSKQRAPPLNFFSLYVLHLAHGVRVSDIDWCRVTVRGLHVPNIGSVRPARFSPSQLSKLQRTQGTASMWSIELILRSNLGFSLSRRY
jgi:hypothetical protein